MKKLFKFILILIIIGGIGFALYNLKDYVIPISDEKIISDKITYNNVGTGFFTENVGSEIKVDSASIEEIPESERDIELESNENYEVTYQKKKATSSYEDICTMGVDSSILYPGALVDMSNDTFCSLNFKRAPLTISMNLESMPNSSANLYTTINKPNTSTVRQGIRDLVNSNITNTTSVPSNLTLEIKDIKSENEFYMNLGFGLQVSKLDIAENFSLNKVKKQTNLVVVLKQVYYTVDVDYEGVSGFLDKTVSINDFNETIKGKIPAYVSSVSYGRIAIISIQTNYSFEEVKNVLNVMWGNMSENPGTSKSKQLSVDFDLTLQNMAKDSDTTINYYVYGGKSDISSVISSIGADSSQTLSSIFNSFNGNEENGLPISYTLRHLNGDNTIAKIQSSDEYVVKNVKYNAKKLMSWTSLNQLLSSKDVYKLDNLKIDLTSLVDFENLENTASSADKTVVIPENIKKIEIIGPNDVASNLVWEGLSFKINRKENNDLLFILKDISFIGDSKRNSGIGVKIEGEGKTIISIEGSVEITGNNGPAIHGTNFEITGNGNLTLTGGYGSDGIYSDGNVIVDLKGKCSIFGGSGTEKDAGGNGITCLYGVNLKCSSKLLIQGGTGYSGISPTNGGTGIDCNDLSIKSEKVFIYGGNGGNALKGTGDGTHGTNGANGGIGIKCKSLMLSNSNEIKGGNGGNGADGCDFGGESGWTASPGGNGGNGGNGANAIYIDGSIESLMSNSYNIIGGNGGNGGNGGKGQYDISPIHTGGTGGNGGNGGDAAYAIENRLGNFYSSGSIGGIGGKAGEAGGHWDGFWGGSIWGSDGNPGKNGTNK